MIYGIIAAVNVQGYYGNLSGFGVCIVNNWSCQLF